MTSALAVVLLWGICFPAEPETPTRAGPAIASHASVRGPFVRDPAPAQSSAQAA